MARNSITTLSERMGKDIVAFRKKIHNFLLENGVKPEDAKLSSVIEALEELNIINSDKNYTHFILDENGYVKSIEKFGAVSELDAVLPPDISRGYYKVVKGKVVLDEAQRQKLWRN